MNRTRNPFDLSAPVKVYWNSHKHCYSMQQRGLVVGHTDSINLACVSFKVHAAGRQRVLRERKKNVHAFIIGTIVADAPFSAVSVAYNPYKFKSFVTKSNNKPIYHASCASLSKNGTILVSA